MKIVICKYGDNVYTGDSLADAYHSLELEYGSDGFDLEDVEFYDAVRFDVIMQPPIVRKAVRKSRAKK